MKRKYMFILILYFVSNTSFSQSNDQEIFEIIKQVMTLENKKEYSKVMNLLNKVREEASKNIVKSSYCYEYACEKIVDIYRKQNDFEGAINFVKGLISEFKKNENFCKISGFKKSLFFKIKKRLEKFERYSSSTFKQSLLNEISELCKGENHPIKKMIQRQLEMTKLISNSSDRSTSNYKGDKNHYRDNEISYDIPNIEELMKSKLDSTFNKLNKILGLPPNTKYSEWNYPDFKPNQKLIDNILSIGKGGKNLEMLKKMAKIGTSVKIVDDMMFGDKPLEDLAPLTDDISENFNSLVSKYSMKLMTRKYEGIIEVAIKIKELAKSDQENNLADHYLVLAYFLSKDMRNTERVSRRILAENSNIYDISISIMYLESLVANEKYDEAIYTYNNLPKFLSKKSQKNISKLNSFYDIPIVFAYLKNRQNKTANDLLKKNTEIFKKGLVDFSLYGEKTFLDYNSHTLPNILPFYLSKRNTKSDSIVAQCYGVITFSKELLLNTSKTIKKHFVESLDSDLKLKYQETLKSDRDSKLYNKKKKYFLIQDEKENIIQNILDNEISWATIKKSIDDDTAVIEFVSYSNPFDYADNKPIFYGAFILANDFEFPVFVELFKEEEINKLLSSHQSNVSLSQQEKINDLFGKNSDELYALIWKNILLKIKNKKTIYFSPIGVLNTIAHNAIKFENTEKTLIDNFELIQLSNSKKVVNYDPNINFNKALLFGHIDYNLSSIIKSDSTKFNNNFWFGELLGTKKEINNISSILDENNIKYSKFLGTKATEEVFKKEATLTTNIIHIASHGFFLEQTNDEFSIGNDIGISLLESEEDPMLKSGLAFAGANQFLSSGKPIDKKYGDGILTASEISNLDLKNLDLIVLSACDTGLGKSMGNEGVFGLQRGIKASGVKFMLVSLWRVSDMKTRQFMNLFYNNLIEKKMNIQSAYAKALKKFKEKNPEPYFWAPFILIN
ncbi:CHAT domain-containing protein [Kordia sp.]|uniref:CHAT domain-containing protein n=1 Tax=Kordia sp. TaxID=1965332 RepID=UPI003D2DEE03